MYKDKDGDGRIPMSTAEYEGVRTLFGVTSMIPLIARKLEERAREIPGAWRDLRLMERLSEKLTAAILLTVPMKKLMAMRSELGRTRIIMTLDKRPDQMDFVVSEEAVHQLITNACELRCFGCGKADWWACETYQAVRDVLPYDLPPQGVQCPLKQE